MNNAPIATSTAVGALVVGAWMIFFPTTEQEEEIPSLAEPHSERTVISTVGQPGLDVKPQALIPIEERTSGMLAPDRETGTPGGQSVDVNAAGGDADTGGIDPSVTPPSPPPEDDVADDYFDNPYPMANEDQSGHETIIAALNAQLDAEPYDSDWASATEQALWKAFYDANPEGSQLDEAVCRSTFCRIGVNHADVRAEQRFLAAFAASGQFTNDDKQGLYQRVVDHNGATRTVFFYARKGHELSADSL